MRHLLNKCGVKGRVHLYTVQARREGDPQNRYDDPKCAETGKRDKCGNGGSLSIVSKEGV